MLVSLGFSERVLAQENADSEKIVFDVDKLFGSTISKMKEELGKPSEEFNVTKAMRRKYPNLLSSAAWNKDGIGLNLDYEANRKINYMFVVNDGLKYSKEELMQLSNLSNDSKDYYLIAQKAIGENGITGLHVCGHRSQIEHCKHFAQKVTDMKQTLKRSSPRKNVEDLRYEELPSDFKDWLNKNNYDWLWYDK